MGHEFTGIIEPELKAEATKPKKTNDDFEEKSTTKGETENNTQIFLIGEYADSRWMVLDVEESVSLSVKIADTHFNRLFFDGGYLKPLEPESEPGDRFGDRKESRFL